MRAINHNQQKLAEKLTILNDRGIGMLTRLYNVKKVNHLVHFFSIKSGCIFTSTSFFIDFE